MTLGVNGETLCEGLTPAAVALFHDCMVELTSRLEILPDKPDESAKNTLSALWHAASGRPISMQRATREALPELDHDAIERLRGLIRDRFAGAPLAYLTGRQEFMGVELIAAVGALIPRDETALLGNAALKQLREIVRERGNAIVIDVCTGSGNLALALAWHEPRARVLASDLSEDAVALARRNLSHLALGDRVEFRAGDLLTPFDTPEFQHGVDLLVCNPPYISSGKVDVMPREIIGHEPRLAFDGGPLGIRILLRLISEAPRFLRNGGWLAFEIGLGQGPGIRKWIEQSGEYVDLKEVTDKSGQIRALIARRTLQSELLRIGKNNTSEYYVVVANTMEERTPLRSLWRAGLNTLNSHEAKFDWYYLHNSEGSPDTLFLHRSKDGELVGAATVGKRRMRLNNAMLVAGVLVDFVVRPEHRTLFPALLLQKEMRKFSLQGHQIVWGLPNPKATAVIGRAGYQCVGQMVRYVRVMRSAEYIARHLPEWMSRMVGPLVDWARFGVMVLRRRGMSHFVTRWQDRPDARFTDLWDRSTVPDQLMGIRDEHYLTWRFVECPFRDHSFFTLVSAIDQRLVGYAVCEFEQKSLHVRDFLVDPDAPAAATHLWRELVREAFRVGRASVCVEFLGCELVQRQLRKAGLIARDQSPLYATIKDRSSPMLLKEHHWYLTSADVDG